MTKTEKAIINQLKKNAVKMLSHYIFSSITEKSDSSNFHDVSTAITYNHCYNALLETIGNIDRVNFKLIYCYEPETVNGLYAKAKKELLKSGLNYIVLMGIYTELGEMKEKYIKTGKCKKEVNDFFRTFETFVWYLDTKAELEELETAYKNGMNTKCYANYELPEKIKQVKDSLKTEKNICKMELQELARTGKLEEFVNSKYGLVPAEFNRYIKDVEQKPLRNEIY